MAVCGVGIDGPMWYVINTGGEAASEVGTWPVVYPVEN
jgi:hypothetical protein